MEIRAIDGSVRYSAKVDTFRELVEKAVAEGVDLSCVSLRWCDLRGAKIAGVKMPGADLTGTDLRDSDLREGDLRWTMQQGIEWESFTKLDGADVTGLDLTGARMLDIELAFAKNHGAYQDSSSPSETYPEHLNLPGSEMPAAFMEQSDLMAVNQ